MPATITVTLLGAAKEAQFSREGTYILQPNDANGNKYWLQGSNAIWYDEKCLNWNIGSIGDGTSSRSSAALCSNFSSNSGPLEATTWNYISGGIWIEATDLIILSTRNKNLEWFRFDVVSYARYTHSCICR